MEREKIVLIDGHSILNRAFFGLPLLSNSEGIHTNAVLGFLNILFRVLDEEKAQYLAVAFDLPAPTFRHKMFAEYKGTRHAMQDELREQVPLIKQVLESMNVPLMSLEGYEADDLLGTVSKSCEEAGLDVRIISGDRDLLQLASDSTMIRIPKTKKGGTEVENYLAKDVQEKYLVSPKEFVDVKALMGDPSDNIPGIPGVGEKTATKIIEKYHSIGNAHDHVDEIRPPKASQSLREHWEDAELSYRLALIDRDVPYQLDLQAAALGEDSASLYTDKALELMKKLELRSMVNRFLTQRERLSDQSASPAPREALEEACSIENPEELQEYLSRAERAEEIGLSLVSEGGDLLGAAISLPGKEEGGKAETAFLFGVRKEDLQSLVKAAKKIIAIGLKEMLSFLDDGSAFPEEVQEKYFDASVGAYLLNPLSGEYGYETLGAAYAKISVPARLEVLGKSKYPALFKKALGKDEEARKALAALGVAEAETALLSLPVILAKLKEQGMEKLYLEVEMPLVFTLYHMQREGILVRGEELSAYGEKLTGRISDLEEEIYRLAGQSFNINSPKQLGTVLFEELKLPNGKKTKTGYSTSADVLDKLAGDYPIVARILEYRQLTKLRSTYAEGLSAFISKDGRIHGTFNQTVTATGRISSTDPNLQNIPVRTELGRELRKIFVPKEGCVFVDADYSQIELRVLAHVSGDENLIAAYNSAEDIHAVTASKVFHVPLEEVTPQLRRNAKAVNFGIVYGISSFGLSQDLSITRKEAEAYIRQYFETYPGIKKYLDECVKSAREIGYSVTMFGRRRPVPELRESNFMRRSFGERVAMNAPIQGSAADIIKIAMVGVDRRLRREGKSRLVLQIHDELLVETERSETELVQKILREEMEGAAKLAVRLEIDMHAGNSWFETH